MPGTTFHSMICKTNTSLVKNLQCRYQVQRWIFFSKFYFEERYSLVILHNKIRYFFSYIIVIPHFPSVHFCTHYLECVKSCRSKYSCNTANMSYGICTLFIKKWIERYFYFWYYATLILLTLATYIFKSILLNVCKNVLRIFMW